MIADHLAAFVAAAEPTTLRGLMGTTWVTVEDGVCEQTMDPPPAMCEVDGTTSMGAIAAFVDSAVGMAGVSNGTSGVTLGLRVELLRQPAPGLIRARARRVAALDGLTINHGELHDLDGVFGHASLRGLTHGWAGDARSSSPRTADAVRPVPASVDELLGVEVLHRGEGGVAIEATARHELASGHGRLHGGAIAMIAERAMRQLLDGSGRRGMVFEIDYLRPVASDDGCVNASARIVNSSRQFIHASAEVRLPDGRVAASARTVAAPV